MTGGQPPGVAQRIVEFDRLIECRRKTVLDELGAKIGGIADAIAAHQADGLSRRRLPRQKPEPADGNSLQKNVASSERHEARIQGRRPGS